MEYVVRTEERAVCLRQPDMVEEQPVDLDITLPDYCPDVQRILKCRLCPAITSRSITGDRLDVEGRAVVKVYYLDARRKSVRLCEHSSPFSCSFPLKGASPDTVARVRLRQEYLNCRALGPRRLDIHGAFSVIASVCSKGIGQYPVGMDGADIRLKTRNTSLSCLSGLGQQPFSVSEVLDVGKGKPSPVTILRSDFRFLPGEHRAIEDKLMLRGEAVLSVLYTTDPETGGTDHMTFHIPVSQVIDAGGIGEDTQNDIRVDILYYDVSLKSEYDENSTLITLDARLCATVEAYAKEELPLIEDAYSTEYDLQLSRSPVTVEQLLCQADMTCSVKEDMAPAEGTVTSVADLWCETLSMITSCENNRLTVRGKAVFCLFGEGAQGEPFYTEKAVDLETGMALPEGSGEAAPHLQAEVVGLQYVISGEKSVSVKADVQICGTIFRQVTEPMITAALSSEDRKREKDEAALTLYYAEAGESLWDIARRYGTSAESIMQANEFTEPCTPSRGMIFVPM